MGLVIGLDGTSAPLGGSLGATNAQANGHDPITTDLPSGTNVPSEDLVLESVPKSSGVTKYCNKCGKDQPFSSFSSKNSTRDGKHSNCRTCQSSYTKSHYQRNKKSYAIKARRNSRKREHEVRMLIRSQKSKPCMDCGVSYPHYVMDFDHLEKGSKKFMLSVAVRDSFKWSNQDVLNEIAKCDLVCANCHRIRTWRRMLDSKSPTKQFVEPDVLL